MNERETAATDKPPVSIWKRLSLFVGSCVLALVAAAVVQHYWEAARFREQLAENLASLGESDPAWQLEDLEKARLAVPEHNSAPVVLEPSRLIPRERNWEERLEPLADTPTP